MLAGDPVLHGYVTALLNEVPYQGAVRDVDGDDELVPPGPGAALAALVRGWTGVCGHDHEDGSRLILLFENLHWADASTLGAIGELVRSLDHAPVWVVGTLDPATSTVTPEDLAGAAASSRLDVVPVGRVQDAAWRAVAESLLGERHADELEALITTCSGRLPLAAAELVNLLLDEGVLIGDNGAWRLAADLGGEPRESPCSLDDILARRIAALHGSARRVVVAASVMGHTFDVAILAEVVDEPVAVLEPVLHELLERGFVRFLPAYWFESRRERDLVLWAQGARRGVFQLGSRRLGDALLRSLPAERTLALHRRVADAIERTHPGPRATHHAETIAGHLLAAGEEARALAWVVRSCERALRLGAVASAAAVAEIGLRLCEWGEGTEARWRATFQRALAARDGGPPA